ncbi:Alpha/beta hydrolase family protein [Phycisphaerae bacterium RAS1]|nr:Alpha/beta hydrolase family protein [Phycisphaerae bacterium RAS1]
MPAYDPLRTIFPAAVHAETWHDARRGRDVPVRLRLPGDAISDARRLPLLVFSHGLGGSRDGYAFLGEHLAARGWLVIHVQHAGSDTAAFRAVNEPLDVAVRRFTSDPENLRHRPLDVSFIIDHIARHDTFAPLVDPLRVAVAGHSFGAYTALAVVGQRVELGRGPAATFRDSRVRAAIAMSPSGAGTLGAAADAWSEIDKPCLLMTGTRDEPPGKRPLRWRWDPFLGISLADAYMMLIDGAHHYSFTDVSGLRIAARSTADPAHHSWICAATTAFLDAHVLGDEGGRRWLADGSLGTLAAKRCTLEYRPASIHH